MALIKCYECSKEISDIAESCPHCGAKNMNKKNKLYSLLQSKWFKVWLLIFVIGNGIWGMYVALLFEEYTGGEIIGSIKNWFFVLGFLISVVSINLLINILIKKRGNRVVSENQEQETMKQNSLTDKKSVEVKEEVTIEKPIRKSRWIKIRLQARMLAVVIFFVLISILFIFVFFYNSAPEESGDYSLSKEITIEMMNDGYTGKGTYTDASGSKYVGEFKDGYRSGQGTYTYPDGAKYVGEFRLSWLHGQGTKTWVSGEKYVGEWKDDKMHGEGTYTTADGKVIKGLFEYNKFIGK